jgi:hypothetical protein
VSNFASNKYGGSGVGVRRTIEGHVLEGNVTGYPIVTKVPG